MAKNKIITTQGNVQFINSKGKTIDMHPMHCYAVYENDTVSFLFIYMKEYSGQAFFASQFEDLEVNGTIYDNMDDLKDAINYAFAKAGAQARTEIVDELPEDPFTNTIYLLPKEHGEGYDEYIWNEDEGWQLIGDTDIEFDRYLQITDFNDYSAATADKISTLSGAIDTNASGITFISGAVDTEISARTASDAFISGAVDTVSSALTSESQRAISAETALQNNIDTANGRIDSEQLARANADNYISGVVNTISGTVNSLSSSKADKVDAVASAEYVESSTTINFKNISGEVISSIDASDFVIDGMIDDVRIETISGASYLVIDFNTASGKEDIQIPLTDIFNPDNYYDKSAIDGIVSGLTSRMTEDETVLEHALNDLDSRINTVSGDVITLGGNVQTLSGEVQTISGSAITSGDVQTQIDNSISGKVNTSDFNSYSASVETALNNKQGTLSAGTNVQINGNVISATDTKYTAGTGIKITSNQISTEAPVYKGDGAVSISCNNPSGTDNGMSNISGVTSFGAGFMVKTNNAFEAAFGTANASNGSSQSMEGDSGKTLFSVGNGSSNNYRHNAFEIRQDGSIYIVNTEDTHTFDKKQMIRLQDAIGGGSITIDPSLDSGSTNPVANSAITSAFDDIEDRISEDEEVTAAALNVVSGQLGGLSLVKLTQQEYDALSGNTDANTLYVIV